MYVNPFAMKIYSAPSPSTRHLLVAYPAKQLVATMQIGMIFLFSLLLVFAEVQAQDSPLEALVKNVRQQGTARWQLSYSKDAYMGGAVNRTGRQMIRLKADHTVDWEHFGKHHTGTWSVDPAGNRITFVFTHSEGVALGDKSYQTDFLLEEYTGQRMVMSQQGRHGAVEMVYQQISKAD